MHITPLRPTDANRILGTFRARIADYEDGGTFITHDEYRAGGRIGQRSGYADLAAAVRDLRIRTTDDVPAAAVIERGGRYFGYVLKARSIEPGTRRQPLAPTHLEPDESAAVLDLCAATRLLRLRAVVDGPYVHRFRT